MKFKPSLIGLLQAIGVIAYCVLIAALINFIGKNAPQQSMGLFGFAAMLVLLVFSAAVTGSIVFGYSAYLFFKEKKIKEPLLILLFTALFSLIILVLAAIIYLLSLAC